MYNVDYKHKVSYGSVKSAPSNIDDSLELFSSLESVRKVWKMFKTSMASKSLSANINKTGYLLSGKKKNVEKYQERKIQNPIWFNRLTIKKKGQQNWLGSIINPIGTKVSTISTISERRHSILNITYETLAA